MTDYHGVMYQLNVGRLYLMFLGKVLVSICGEKNWQVWRSSLTHDNPNLRPRGRQDRDGGGKGTW